MFETYILPILIFAVLGVLAGVLLTFASKVFAVKTDEKLEKINEMLPNINCGACGYSGCADYAVALLKNEAAVNLCKPGGDKTAVELSELLGIEFQDVLEEVAFVRCAGSCNNTSTKYVFDGTQSCVAAGRFYKGSKVCTSGFV